MPLESASFPSASGPEGEGDGSGDYLTHLAVSGTPTLEHVDLEALSSFRCADGSSYPASFREFIRHAGWGRLAGLWLIYPPVLPGYADGIQGRGAHLTAHVHSVYREGRDEGFDWMIEPDGTWAQVPALQVFGWSENGDALLWDTASRTSDGEFPVWESRSCDSLHLLGGSLTEALPLIVERARGLCGSSEFDVEPLPGQLI
ncbi:MAG: hypothetical protein ACTJHU_04120 [Mycetocola sp.]